MDTINIPQMLAYSEHYIYTSTMDPMATEYLDFIIANRESRIALADKAEPGLDR
jgi:hypothetical protein